MGISSKSIDTFSERLFDQKVVKLSLEHPSILTIRELEVLRLIADGCTTKSIAGRLQITFTTARAYRFSIRKKLAVDSTVLAVRWAIREGLIEP
jgi:DNA-binding NarL/FixJ family response regulator